MLLFIGSFVQLGSSPLVLAAHYGHLDTAEALLDQGADVHAANIVRSYIVLLYPLHSNYSIMDLVVVAW